MDRDRARRSSLTSDAFPGACSVDQRDCCGTTRATKTRCYYNCEKRHRKLEERNNRQL